MSVEPPGLREDDHGGADGSRAALRCVECGYRLRGTTGDACPECGFSVAASRREYDRLHFGLEERPLWFAPRFRAINLVMILLPSAVAVAVFLALRLTGFGPVAQTAAVLSVLAVVFSPILALLTMPWRGVYEDGAQHGLAWRLGLLAVQWALLLWAAAWVVWGS